MKRLFFIISFLLLLTTFEVEAQIANIGFRGGFNSNKYIIDTKNFTAGDARYGFTGGVFFRLKIGAISLQPEMLYSQKNGLYSYASLSAGLDTLIHNSIDYFDVPVLFNIHFGKKLRIGTGPVFSQVASEAIQYQNTEQEYMLTIDKKAFKEVAYSWQFAVGYEIKRFVIDVRYEYSVEKINYSLDIPSSSISLNPDLRNELWQFTIGYKLVK